MFLVDNIYNTAVIVYPIACSDFDQINSLETFLSLDFKKKEINFRNPWIIKNDHALTNKDTKVSQITEEMTFTCCLYTN